MNKLYLCAVALVSLVVLATSPSVAMAKGTVDNPAVVIIDQTDSNNDVDANITNDSSNPVPVSHPTMTHMGQTPQDHVSFSILLDPVCGSSSFALERFLPDGTRTGVAFVVPVGKVLVITDISAVVSEVVPWSVGNVAHVGLGNYKNGVAITPEALSAKVIPVNNNINSGILFGAGEAPCASAGVDTQTGWNLARIRTLFIQGYLTDE